MMVWLCVRIVCKRYCGYVDQDVADDETSEQTLKVGLNVFVIVSTFSIAFQSANEKSAYKNGKQAGADEATEEVDALL
jgi:hypothetical protein